MHPQIEQLAEKYKLKIIEDSAQSQGAEYITASGQIKIAGNIGHASGMQGLLPICCYCKKIRDDGNYWHRVESYIAGHANVRFSHGICPDCNDKLKAELNL